MKGTFKRKRQAFCKEKVLGGGVLLVMIFLLTLTNANAYIKTETNNNIKYKFYINMNKAYCFDLVNSISNDYLIGINYIKVMPHTNTRRGQYWPGIIELFGDCTIETTIHELAHHCQYRLRDQLGELIGHKGNFKNCEDNIWQSLKE